MMVLQARAGIQIDYGQPRRIPDVQNLIMWTLADGANPQWAFLKVLNTHTTHKAWVHNPAESIFYPCLLQALCG